MWRIPRRRRLIWGSGAAVLVAACLLVWFYLGVGHIPAGAIVVPRDFPTIQDALKHTSPGATIVVRAGGGPYQGPLVIRTSEISIIATGGRAVITCNDAAEPGITIGARGVTLRGFEVKAPGIGVQLDLASDVTLTDVVIIGARIGIQMDRSNGNSITAVRVRDGKTGIEMTSANRNTLRRIRIASVADVGITLSNSWSNTIEDVAVNGAQVGISLEDDSEENRIAAFRGDDCSTSGVEMINSSSNTLTASSFTDCGIGIALTTAKNNTIERNRIRNSLKKGISLYKSQQNMFSLNTISSGLKDGIHLSESRSNSLVYNSVTGCGGTGIMLESGKSNLLLANRIDRNAIGIQCLEGMRNRVLRNKLSGNALAGIVLSEGADNLFLDNTVTETAYGIALIGSTGNQFLRNTVTTCSADGISLLNRADRTLLQDNIIEKNDIGVLVAASSQSSIADNHIRACRTAVKLFQSGTGTRVEGNLIADNSVGVEIASELNKDETILRGTDAELIPGEAGFHLVLANNTFAHNTSHAISNLTDAAVYAAGNYWSGRSEAGRVAGKVILPRSSWKGTVALGTTDSLDQIIIARILQQALTADGIKVIDLIGLGDARMVKAALLAGDVDLALADPSDVDAEELTSQGITISPPLAVEDRLSLVVSPDIAGSLSGNTISDLAAYLSNGGVALKLAVQNTIPQEQVRSLVSAYGIPLTTNNTVWTTGIDETETLLKLGTANAGIVHSIEETVTMLGFQVLDDERGVLRTSHTAFLAPQRVIDSLPEVGAVEQRLRPLLTTDTVHSLVSKVRLLHMDPREAVQ